MRFVNRWQHDKLRQISVSSIDGNRINLITNFLTLYDWLHLQKVEWKNKSLQKNVFTLFDIFDHFFKQNMHIAFSMHDLKKCDPYGGGILIPTRRQSKIIYADMRKKDNCPKNFCRKGSESDKTFVYVTKYFLLLNV